MLPSFLSSPKSAVTDRTEVFFQVFKLINIDIDDVIYSVLLSIL